MTVDELIRALRRKLTEAEATIAEALAISAEAPHDTREFKRCWPYSLGMVEGRLRSYVPRGRVLETAEEDAA